jgi:hypothetical protein
MPVAVLDDSDERFQLGDSSEGSMAQLNPTSDTDTTAATTAARRHRRSTLKPHHSAGHCPSVQPSPWRPRVSSPIDVRSVTHHRKARFLSYPMLTW